MRQQPVRQHRQITPTLLNNSKLRSAIEHNQITTIALDTMQTSQLNRTTITNQVVNTKKKTSTSTHILHTASTRQKGTRDTTESSQSLLTQHHSLQGIQYFRWISVGRDNLPFSQALCLPDKGLPTTSILRFQSTRTFPRQRGDPLRWPNLAIVLGRNFLSKCECLLFEYCLNSYALSSRYALLMKISSVDPES
jgi:hypothetical protein